MRTGEIMMKGDGGIAREYQMTTYIRVCKDQITTDTISFLYLNSSFPFC